MQLAQFTSLKEDVKAAFLPSNGRKLPTDIIRHQVNLDRTELLSLCGGYGTRKKLVDRMGPWLRCNEFESSVCQTALADLRACLQALSESDVFSRRLEELPSPEVLVRETAHKAFVQMLDRLEDDLKNQADWSSRDFDKDIFLSELQQAGQEGGPELNSFIHELETE